MLIFRIMELIGVIMIIRSPADLQKAVRILRKQRGLTQTEAAQLIGHSRKWLSSLETGATQPPVDMVINLLVLLGAPIHLDMPGDPRRPARDNLPPSDMLDIDEGL
jgi:transcriptional regulator with XRE-family HTH domain